MKQYDILVNQLLILLCMCHGSMTYHGYNKQINVYCFIQGPLQHITTSYSICFLLFIFKNLPNSFFNISHVQPHCAQLQTDKTISFIIYRS